MFLHLSVSHSVHRGGVCPCACWDTHPRADTPLGRHPLPSACWNIHGYCCRRFASYWNAFLLPPAMKLGQGYVFTGVCHSVNRGDVCLSAPGIHPPGPGTPPKTRYTPQDQVQPPRPGTPPKTRYNPQDQVHPPRPGAPPPKTRYTPPTTTAAGGTHPTGMHSCFKIKFE